MNKEKIFIVIAAFNEEKSIARVISGLHKHGYSDIVVVDDGSDDGTSGVAASKGVFVLRHSINRGQGASLKTGIDFALLRGADFIVTFDADGQHQPEDINLMLLELKKHRVDVALGSRFLRDAPDIPFVRKLALKIGIIVTWLFYGVKLSDSHNGFRIFSRKAAELIDITSDRMEHASQIIEEIHRKNISFIEFPVIITYSDYSKAKGQSTLNSVKIFFRMLFRKLTH